MVVKKCWTQKEIREFLEDALSPSEISTMLGTVKVLGHCNAQNDEQRFFIVKESRGYSVTKGLPIENFY